ncbi:MAG: LCP family protein [Lachnospiraceae bacterium]|nr:LCP family protein [Lachnospiraceae bacterium]
MREDYEYQEYLRRKRNKKRALARKKRRRRIILFSLEIAILLVLIIGVFVYAKVNSSLRKLGTAPEVTSQTQEVYNPDKDVDNVIVNQEAAVDKVMSGYTNILLLGIDARDYDDPDYCNSDTMIICSINNDNGEVRLLSVYRDTMLNTNPAEPKYTKANDAYCQGSITQCLSMINTNLDLSITDYLIVDFKALATMVDDIGGITIDLSQEEAVHVNNYSQETSAVTGMAFDPLPEVAGTYTLNGVQAVSYSRIRYTAGQDMKRAQRQRLVIMKIIEKVRQSGIAGVEAVINDVFPLCRTNLSNAMIIKMARQMIGYYDIVDTAGFPFVFREESQYVNPELMVPITLAQNVTQLHQFLFQDMNYSPSGTVWEYSDYIAEASGFDESAAVGAQISDETELAASEADTIR